MSRGRGMGHARRRPLIVVITVVVTRDFYHRIGRPARDGRSCHCFFTIATDLAATGLIPARNLHVHGGNEGWMATRDVRHAGSHDKLDE